MSAIQLINGFQLVKMWATIRLASEASETNGGLSEPVRLASRRTPALASSRSLMVIQAAICAPDEIHRFDWGTSPPTSAVSETLLGAENVASHPALWPIVLRVLPSAVSYSCASRCSTSRSPVRGCLPSDILAKSSARTSPLSPRSVASLPCHSPRTFSASAQYDCARLVNSSA